VQSIVGRRTRAWCIGVAVYAALLCVSNPSSADQGEEAVENLSEQTEVAAEALGEKRFFVMPIPISNPTIGTGLGLATMYLFQAGENAPPSSFMLGGFWADSKSWAGVAGGTMHFKDDIYRLSGCVGYFDVNLEFFGIGNDAGDQGQSVSISQSGPFLAARLLRRIVDRLYLGAHYRLVTINTALTDLPDWLPGDILRDGIELTSSGLGLVLQYDSRDNEFNPLTGSCLDLTSRFSREAIGSDRDYEQYTVGYNYYGRIAKDKVLAWRATGCVTAGDAPFYDISMFGGGSDGIRGYVGGQYRDDVSLTTQLEYRWKFYKKWGMVAFGGVGQVAPSISEMDTSNLLPSYGVGVRFMVSDEQRINLGIDYARGKDSYAWYFRIAEAF
jgi:hypothetical protein